MAQKKAHEVDQFLRGATKAPGRYSSSMALTGGW